jgi:hypothetical protein
MVLVTQILSKYYKDYNLVDIIIEDFDNYLKIVHSKIKTIKNENPGSFVNIFYFCFKFFFFLYIYN